MDTLRQSLYKQAQRGVALIVHKLFEPDSNEEVFIEVSNEEKEEAKRIISDILHSSRRTMEKEFCKGETSAQVDGRGTGQAEQGR